jgi:hypothetical protein
VTAMDERIPVTELTFRVQRVETEMEKLTRLAASTNDGVTRIEKFLTGDEMTNHDGLIRRVKTLESLADTRLEVLKSHERFITEANQSVQELSQDTLARFENLEDAIDDKFANLKEAPGIARVETMKLWKMSAIAFVMTVAAEIIKVFVTGQWPKH